ncbi:MAG: AMP-binding protein [Rikenellaceae bacterium]
MIKENYIELYEKSFNENWDLDALTDYFKKESFTYGQLANEISRLHILFGELGIKKGDRVALIGRNNPRWCISYLAAVTYGAVIVPILQEFNANDVHHIINHSGSRILFSGDVFWDSLDPNNVEDLQAVFSLTDFECLWASDRSLRKKCGSSRITDLFKAKYPKGIERGTVKYDSLSNDSLIIINYTSGTTGFSKGVMLTANNICGNVMFGHSINIHFPGSRALAFLPLAHAFGCTFDFLFPLTRGAHVTLLGKIPSPRILLDALAEVKPHILFMVPLLIEKIYKKQILPMLDKKILKFSLKVPIVDTTIHTIIRNKLVKSFGGELTHVIIGGAAINSEVEDFLRLIKFPFTIGYGMTECAPLISYTDYKEFKSRSCGKILDGLMEARIDSEDPQNIVGEIHVRGEHVMQGYYKNPEATDAVLTDGWLNTGDLGTMDEDGTLYIRGRSKSMILGASGQNIYPEEIESKLNNLPFVGESLVVERDGKLVALVYPDSDQCDAKGVQGAKSIGERMNENLPVLNSQVAPFERVSKIVLYPTEFEKTPKKSIKRYLYNV